MTNLKKLLQESQDSLSEMVKFPREDCLEAWHREEKTLKILVCLRSALIAEGIWQTSGEDYSIGFDAFKTFENVEKIAGAYGKEKVCS